MTGGGTTYHRATVYGAYGQPAGSVSGTSSTPATFGVVGSAATNYTVYDRLLLVVIRDRKGSDVFEGRVQSSGMSPEATVVLPAMINSLFREFPGASGQTARYSEPLD